MIGQLIKKSTGITGLKVQPQARQILSELYNQTLTKLQIIPTESAYRRDIESMTRFRLNVVQKETDIIKIENTIYGGQVEELIEQAKNELKVIDVVHKSRAWESDKNKPTVVLYSKF
ncbi:hypothetical protein DICPUDRAFT_29534 [Dictyostelium purpureum]|uniref:Uncharacterized protein n=1 Tax=Dictyostelium purpureum TaxID=5786 RepID=F0ZDQ3_DICPU|nr:uncharacterized protein DICPUDRAFT_29534 [Dictyostelium purpureum]EGC37887.1 hypothetical protein DICPUDRAFT_29534 [Dictyostelium purpureum]|eukprot:XP_003285547.1 hypothetical protein DICPUDRAFT_29534 [Dictyostelium purpureum]